MIDASEWKWFGSAGHLIVGRCCRFHLCTQVGPWMVSTVGEYVRNDQKGIEEVGCGRTYETMVFRAGSPCEEEECAKCGMPTPDDWGGLDFKGYNSNGDATRGHIEMCLRWAAKDSQ